MARTVRRTIFGSVGLSLGLALTAVGGGVASCGKADESLVSPCDSKIECGAPCDVGKSCVSGQYCGADDKCTADCVVGDARCGEDQRCNGATGRCVTGTIIDVGGTTGNGGPGSGGDDGTCASTDVNLDNQLPTVLLLVDQSGSMNANFGRSDRWQTLRTALMDPMEGIVNTLQGQVRFGLSLYSSLNGAAPCPALTNVAPALNNFGAIDMAYPRPTSAILDDTPTGDSIIAAAKILAAVTEPGPKVIVVATDGEPDSCATPDPQTPAAKELVIKAAQDAFAMGVFTFYISVGNEVSEEHATEVANVGQGYPRTDRTKRFYLANDQAALADAFKTIVNGVRTCSFQLNGTVKDGAEGDGTVTLDGMVLKLGDPNGWRLSSPSTIELLGSACDAIKSSDKNSTHHISATFTCGAVIPFKPPE
ncbi:MAG: VWA domain-containing protein [Myxococcales bacterium]|nr:MAG: VWA domain-containing protein [Myxococcales bacterium]